MNTRAHAKKRRNALGRMLRRFKALECAPLARTNSHRRCFEDAPRQVPDSALKHAPKRFGE
eukprot:14854216-Alexandrium_andersonii.AAC.1